LAGGDEDVLDAIAVIDQRVAQSDWLVSPSVLEELAFLNESGERVKLRQSARIAFQQLQSGHRFRAIIDLPFPSNFIRGIADEIRQRQLIPATELHDSLIPAEAALMECAILLTSDAHLRGVDHELLTLVLNPFDLTPPVIATPREIVRKFFRQGPMDFEGDRNVTLSIHIA
jgi:hypothetical protein